MDRRAILERLAQGEKQAALAKEFQVSRAAICNLFKHRDEVLSRVDESPFTKHPKKKKPMVPDQISGQYEGLKKHNTKHAATVSIDESTRTASRQEASPLPSIRSVREVKYKSIELLLSVVRDYSSTDDQFRRASERLFWLLLEEALASVEITKSATSSFDGSQLEVARYPACGITLEQRSCPMLDVFQLIQPDAPTAYARIQSGDSRECEYIELLDAHLPSQLLRYNVFLLDVVLASGEALCATIQNMKAREAQDDRIFVVSLFLSSNAVAMVQSKFPQVTLITTHIDSAITKRSSRNAWYNSLVGRLDRIYGRAHELLGVQF
ncbi:hypothetical protein ATCC90586_002560 [Pythium insidiosum]|nr:hypothetical protein ATCC90586_002560 [Pythium insidiosum]